MGEIQSSWEIARKKADLLGELSVDEQRKQREEICQPVAKSLVDKYLDEQDARRLKKELDVYQAEDKNLIRQMAIHRLIDCIELQNSSILDKAISGVLILVNNEMVGQVVGQIKQLFIAYGEIEKTERQKIEIAGREILHQQRISGTAISMINIRAREEWQERLKEIAQPFEKQLYNLKQELSRSVTGS